MYFVMIISFVFDVRRAPATLVPGVTFDGDVFDRDRGSALPSRSIRLCGSRWFTQAMHSLAMSGQVDRHAEPTAASV